jgi:hypothetical protein
MTKDGRPNDSLVAAYAAIHAVTVNIRDAYSDEDEFDFSGTRVFDARTGYRSQSFLTVPMRNHEGDVIGVLAVDQRQPGIRREVVAFSGGGPEPGRVAGLAGGHCA